jgi:hypothetical protein
MRRNIVPPLRVIPHEVLLPQATPLSFGAQLRPTETRQSYDLEQIFERGTLIAALRAETDMLAEQAIDEFIASGFPPSSFDQGFGILSPFWLNLATCNGHPLSRNWTAFKDQRKQHVLAAIELAERDGWIFRLPFWPLADHPDREPLIFFSDTGIHRRLMMLWELREEQNAADQENTDSIKATAIRRGVSHVVGSAADLRFQGFATHVLTRIVPEARPFVFDRPAKGEIDLILDGPKSERWAFEITNGEPSEKPSRPKMFDLHCEELGIDPRRRRVVYRAATSTRERAKAGVIAVNLPNLLAELVGRRP